MMSFQKSKIHFYKMTGAGNDFIFIDNRNGIVGPDHCRDFVRSACRRKLSVGADGMMLIENDPEVDFKWRFFNSDGSEAEMCGNGARCAVRFAYLTGIAAEKRMAFRTLAGVIRGEILDGAVKVEMPPPRGLETGIRLESAGRSFELDSINTGVPHAVCYLSDENGLNRADVEGWGRELRYHPRFRPAGSNIDFAWIRDNHRMSVRTYERGVEGETLACGTGVTAAVLAAAARNLVAGPVEVKTRGGECLTIHFKRDRERFREVFMEGEARVVYEADLWDDTEKL